MRETVRTNSTISTDCRLPLSPRDHPGILEPCHKSARNPSRCLIYKIQMTTTEQSEPVSNNEQRRISDCTDGTGQERTCAAIYAVEAAVTEVMPWMRALPDRVALTSFSTKLSEVNTCLNALSYHVKTVNRDDTNMKSALHESSALYSMFAYINTGHWPPATAISSPCIYIFNL